jgi:hypothetical protein
MRRLLTVLAAAEGERVNAPFALVALLAASAAALV